MNHHQNNPFAGTVYYDGGCSHCTNLARLLTPSLTRRGYKMETLQSRPDAAVLPMTEMLLRLPDARELGGADAAVSIFRNIWWAWPVYALAQVPGMMWFMRRMYRFIAANRYCLSGACQITPAQHHRTITFLELP